jgi:hypothetical protein
LIAFANKVIEHVPQGCRLSSCSSRSIMFFSKHLIMVRVLGIGWLTGEPKIGCFRVHSIRLPIV